MGPTTTNAWPPPLISLYESERLRYIRVAYLITGRVDVAQELVQDAFLAVAPRWSTIEHPKAYLRTAVTNRARDHLRRAKLDLERSEPAPDVVVDTPDELWDALERLDDRHRIAIVLRFYEDLPDDEIAEIIGCRPATVRSLVHRGIAALRREVTR